ncbi:MAG: DUF3667 domain-containing protein [Paramuribaculum sp.]|nr:DUF3667 domain-containing protein [Paramuribaculum sp.]
MATLKEKWNAYKQWQKQPFQVAPMSDERHICSTCATEYQGNYCPRCGQSAKVVPKMSLLKTFLLFIDVWGLGNRGMFRTLRDLIFRPGYLICDYLRGMHQAYFPPFKLLFLLTTLSLLIGHGWNLSGENYDKDFQKIEKKERAEMASLYKQDAEKKAQIKSEEKLMEEEEDEMIRFVLDKFVYIRDIQIDYPALYQIAFMLLTTVFYFILFRKSKIIGRFSFHEFFIAMIYISDMVGIYTCLFRFFGLSPIWITISGITYLIPLKQMTGYSWGKTIWRYLLTWIMVLVAISIFIVLIAATMASIIELRHL